MPLGACGLLTLVLLVHELHEVHGREEDAFEEAVRTRWMPALARDADARLLTSEVPARYKEPGTWMHDALALRDRWESRLLRTVDWSPWY